MNALYTDDQIHVHIFVGDTVAFSGKNSQPLEIVRRLCVKPVWVLEHGCIMSSTKTMDLITIALTMIQFQGPFSVSRSE